MVATLGNYTGGSPRPHAASVSAPGPSSWEAPPITADVSQYQRHSQSQMPSLGGSGEAEGGAAEGAAAEGAEGAAEAGATDAAASIPELLGFL